MKKRTEFEHLFFLGLILKSALSSKIDDKETKF